MQRIPAPKPGIYPNVPDRDYHAWDAASYSRLKVMLQSAAHCRWQLEHPPETTKSLVLGSAFHAAILEPDRFAAEFGRAPEGLDRRTSAGKAAWAELVDAFGADYVLSATDYDCCLAMAESVRDRKRHATSATLLEQLTERELSIVWEDPETSVLCKGRLDGLVDGITVADWKTCQDARRGPFMRTVTDYGYYLQAAMYLEGLAVLGKPIEHYTLVPVEKEAPHEVAVYRLAEEALEVGRVEIRDLLLKYAACQKTGMWPGYDDYVQDLSLPEWKLKLVQGVAA